MSVRMENHELSVEAQLQIWGYCISGPEPLERAALICERRLDAETFVPGCWDYGVEFLAHHQIQRDDGPWEQPPQAWCLPWVMELKRQRSNAFWDVVQRASEP